jgi:hypothetical protein
MDIAPFVEEKINTFARKILEGGAKVDEHALGELLFYITLRRVLSGKGTPQDLGLVDAVNDTLQQKGIVKPGTTFLK